MVGGVAVLEDRLLEFVLVDTFGDYQEVVILASLLLGMSATDCLPKGGDQGLVNCGDMKAVAP